MPVDQDVLLFLIVLKGGLKSKREALCVFDILFLAPDID
jgi:hypothetical protein